MSNSLIIGLVVFFVIVFSIAMFIVFKVVKKNQSWFGIKPLVEFNANDINEEHKFTIDTSDKYVFCIVVKRDLKLVRPPLYKIDFNIYNDTGESLDLSKGITVFKQINGLNIREMNYVLAEFEATHVGNYSVKVMSDKGIYPTDRFFIRPKLSLIN